MPAIMEAIDAMTTKEKVDMINYLWSSVAASGEAFVPVWQVVDLPTTPETRLKRKSMFGALKGKIGMTDDFDDPIDDFAEYM